MSNPSGGGPGGGPGGEPPETSGDEPTTGSPTEGTTGDETGGLVPTRELCDRYLECLAVTQPEALPSAQMGFGAEGTCWSGPPEQIEQCITACYTGLGDAHEAFPDEPKCVQCQQDEECLAGERCVSGGCHVSYCGDGLVEPEEICDDPDDWLCFGCDAHENLECNVFSDAGCEAGERCVFAYPNGLNGCVPDDTDGPGDGEVCDYFSNDFCGSGLVCAPAAVLQGCPGDACCTLLCNTQEPDACSNGRVCTPHFDSNYVGVCELH